MEMDRPAQRRTTPIAKTSFHHGDLYNAAIYAVAQLIGERKGLGFQIKDVAKLVGTSQPALYKHFNGKSALLVEVAVEGYKLQKELRDHALKRADDSPLSGVLAICLSYIYFSRIYPGFFLLIKNLVTDDIQSSRRYLAERTKTGTLISDTIQRCLDDGLFAPIDIQLAATVMNSTVYGVAHLYLVGQMDVIAPDRTDDPAFPERIIRKSLDAFLTAKGKDVLEALPLGHFLRH